MGGARFRVLAHLNYELPGVGVDRTRNALDDWICEEEEEDVKEHRARVDILRQDERASRKGFSMVDLSPWAA
jgi:hypothetical protein